MQEKTGFQYHEDDPDSTLYENCQQCCGSLVGCCKGWVPCFGCFCCCCDSPYITIPQGSKGLFMRYHLSIHVGRYKKYLKTISPGLIYINPVTESIVPVDCRISVISMPVQRLMTRDNISISVQSCVYYHINQPHLTYYRMGDLEPAIVKVCGGIIKNTVVTFTFQELLQKKEEISHDVQKQIQPIIKSWGIAIDNICIKNFGISKELESQLVSAPIARRNAESKIIQAQGQVQIAKLLGNRSKILDSKTAIQVRYLETLKELARNPKSKMMYTAS